MHVLFCNFCYKLKHTLKIFKIYFACSVAHMHWVKVTGNSTNFTWKSYCVTAEVQLVVFHKAFKVSFQY